MRIDRGCPIAGLSRAWMPFLALLACLSCAGNANLRAGPTPLPPADGAYAAAPNLPERDKSGEAYRWLASIQEANGLLPSCEDSARIYAVSLYDQALAAMAFLVMGDVPRAQRTLDYFSSRVDKELAKGLGGFYQFRSVQGRLATRDARGRWLGDNAWLLLAVANYEAITGDAARYRALRQGLERWISSLQDADGGLIYGSVGEARKDQKILEGNIDAFGAMAGYTAFHGRLLAFLASNWDRGRNSLITWPNAPNPDWVYACDTASWAYLAIEGFPSAALDRAEGLFGTRMTVNGARLAGFCFDGDRDTIHPEATLGMVVAWNLAGSKAKAESFLADTEPLFLPGHADRASFGLPYASGPGTSYGGDELSPENWNRPWVSSTAWYLFARRGFNPFGCLRAREIPELARFWED